MKALFILGQKLLPQHLLSRLTGRLAEAKTAWLKNFLIRRFIRRYGVNMEEALFEHPEDFATFNAFFTRALKAGSRPVAQAVNAIASPADGVVSAAGAIEGERLFQAKGRDFSLAALLGGSSLLAQRFENGSFVTVYLSPKDYHRVHMPLGGTLEKMLYVPGDLYSVNQVTCEAIDNLFARNERAVCLFETAAGPMAVILVGAMIVAGIETVWSGRVAPASSGLTIADYTGQQSPVTLERGDEMGRFCLGSTAIILFGPKAAAWREDLAAGTTLRMGESIGSFTRNG